MISTSIRALQHLYHNKRMRVLLSDSWRMSWPLIIVMFLEFLVSLTDVFVAGKIGRETQAAVGFSAQMYFVFVVLANAMTQGTVSVISKLHGAGKHHDFANAIKTIVAASIVIGILLTAIAYCLTPLIISFSSVPSEIIDITRSFIKVYLIALPFHYLLTMTNGILRATKRSIRSLVTMLIVGVINIGLNLYFLSYTDLSFKGIALSTVISIIIGSLINWISIRPMMSAARNFSWQMLKRVSQIGLPNLILQISWQTGSLVLFLILGLLGDQSVNVIAAFTTGLRIEAAIFLPAYALNMSAAALSGNLLGSGNKKDAFAIGIITALTGMFIIVVISIIVIINARSIASQLSSNPLVINECVRYLIIQMVAEPFMAVLVILSGALNGAGDTAGVMRIVVGGMWLIRLPLSWFLAIHLGFGPAAVWVVMDVDIVIRMSLILHRYLKKDWLSHA